MGRLPSKVSPKCIFWKDVVLHCPEFHTTPVTHPESHMPSLPSARSKSTHRKLRAFSQKMICWLLPPLVLLRVWWILMFPGWAVSDEQCQLSAYLSPAERHLKGSLTPPSHLLSEGTADSKASFIFIVKVVSNWKRTVLSPTTTLNNVEEKCDYQQEAKFIFF